MRLPNRFVLLLCSSMLIVDSSKAEQFSYEPSESVLAGHIEKQVFAGPPNYESVADGDRQETVWIFVLDHPVTVNADPKSDINSTTENDVQRVQLIWSGSESPDPRLIGPKVTIKGQFFHAHTIRHRTPVVLRATSMRSDLVIWNDKAGK